ncbi:MAG: PIN domain-containing protein [Bacteroidales bacterium]|nr:PIN domain-containing protein [Bacteroidales bacterium]
MYKYILDTNICIEYFKKRNGVAEKIAQIDFKELCISEITYAELLFGALHSKSVERHLNEVNDFKNDIGTIAITETIKDYAEIRQHLVSNGLSVEDFDILIGATARHYNLILVTDNVKHFSQMPGVKIENWVRR